LEDLHKHRDLKTKLLSLLYRTEGFLSGEEVSGALGITRAAIWKQIKQLREEGFAIESRPRRGYRLLKMPDRLYPHALLAGLKTSSLGQRIEYYPSVDSTNTAARDLAEKGAPEGTVVVSEEQTSGKGRRGRGWVSPYGKGIWTSIILRPSNMEPQAAPQLTLLAAVAASEAIKESTRVKAEIKWPNDILISGRKVCGILTEVKAELDLLHYVVIGCGINVNQQKSDFPPELHSTATSLLMETGENVTRLLLWQKLLENLEKLYHDMLAEGFKNIRLLWRKNSVTLGRQVEVTTPNGTCRGIARDIDMEGALLVEAENGQTHRFIAGEVTLRPKNN
jgi:BirA family biotin operon repressor/biotin-[acetyl-CoA-carboxylase] ligase